MLAIGGDASASTSATAAAAAAAATVTDLSLSLPLLAFGDALGQAGPRVVLEPAEARSRPKLLQGAVASRRGGCRRSCRR
jgi:hypothetical protein